MIRVGISGWRYAPWRGVFYPPGLPQRRELEYAAQRLGSIELNGSFYSLQRPGSYRTWAEQTPEDFVFSVKGGRFITHMLRLRGVETALANFFASGPLALGPKLGPVLWQLPERHPYDAQELGAFLDLLPRTTGQAAALAGQHDARVEGRAWTSTDLDRPLEHVLEVRHPSFRTPDFLDLLARHRVGVVVADTAGRWPAFDAVTSPVVYVRLHGEEELYVSGYGAEALDRWAERVRAWAREADVYVYFDNDVKVHAPHDAMALAAQLGVGPSPPAEG
jgi:uncharacterized protein YecE (DUF72 family)